MKFNIIITILIMTFLIMSSMMCEAAKIDLYRNAMLNKSFTLKYEIKKLPVRRTNKEMNLSNFGLFSRIFNNSIIEMLYDEDNERKLSGGIIVVDGENQYIEVDRFTDVIYGENRSIEKDADCTLIKNGDFYKFYFSGSQNKYYSDQGFFGNSKNVKANYDKEDKNKNPFDKMIEEYNYGNPLLSQALAAILPHEKIIAMPNTPIYQFINSGTLSNGLSFEDFAGFKNNIHYAIRYYFSGDKLVKISTINYLKDENGIQSYKKATVNIIEFSLIPEQGYLSLPEGLKAKK